MALRSAGSIRRSAASHYGFIDLVRLPQQMFIGSGASMPEPQLTVSQPPALTLSRQSPLEAHEHSIPFYVRWSSATSLDLTVSGRWVSLKHGSRQHRLAPGEAPQSQRPPNSRCSLNAYLGHRVQPFGYLISRSLASTAHIAPNSARPTAVQVAPDPFSDIVQTTRCWIRLSQVNSPNSR